MTMYDEMNEQISRMKHAHATAADPDSADREHAIVMLESAVGKCLKQLEVQDNDQSRHLLWALIGWNR